RSLDRSRPEDSIYRKLLALLSQCHQHLGQGREALSVCRQGRRLYPDDAELLFEEGRMLLAEGNLAGAEACLVQLLEAPAGVYFASVDPALRGHRARHLLGAICLQTGRLADAEGHWRRALDERPDYVPALLGLGDLYASQGRWQDL